MIDTLRFPSCLPGVYEGSITYLSLSKPKRILAHHEPSSFDEIAAYALQRRPAPTPLITCFQVAFTREGS